MTAGGENEEAKLNAAAEHTRQQFIRKQLSHLEHIKDVTQGKEKIKIKLKKKIPAKSVLIMVLTSKTSFNSVR